MNIGGHTIGVCSWSLHPKDTADLVTQTKQAGLSHVQLGLAGLSAKHHLSLLMETGQEKAEELLEFLHDLKRDNVFINFDPANMILYGAGEPIAAIKTLGQFIRHVHVKDANPSTKPGVDWGEE